MPIGQKERKPKVGTLFKSDKMTKERKCEKTLKKMVTIGREKMQSRVFTLKAKV